MPRSSASRRGRRASAPTGFEEFVTELDALLRDRELTIDGRFWSAVEARAYPGCVQHPRVPFAIAGNGPRGMRLAARLADTWVTTGERDFDEQLDGHRGAIVVAGLMRGLDAACEAEGRDPSTLRRLVLADFQIGAGLDDVRGDLRGLRGRRCHRFRRALAPGGPNPSSAIPRCSKTCCQRDSHEREHRQVVAEMRACALRHRRRR